MHAGQGIIVFQMGYLRRINCISRRKAISWNGIVYEWRTWRGSSESYLQGNRYYCSNSNRFDVL